LYDVLKPQWRKLMRSLALFFLLLSVLSWAQSSTNEYSINVHVTSSQWGNLPANVGTETIQRLSAIIDGKKYELAADDFRSNLQHGVTLLALGDYKAKLVQDVHKTTYESSQAYEFQFADKKTQKFIVVGQSE
jgi:hypothetical protein